MSGFMFPPRPTLVIAPSALESYGVEWAGQIKSNGCCSVLSVPRSGKPTLYGKDGQVLSNVDKSIDFRELGSKGGDTVLCGEYMNKNKKREDGRKFNHVFVLWDALMIGGRSLRGATTDDRLRELEEIMPRGRDGEWLLRYTSAGPFYMARTLHTSHKVGFLDMFNECSKVDFIEGLVLKRRNARLEPCVRASANSGWMVKARKPTNSYDI
jgi:hypothetical protein